MFSALLFCTAICLTCPCFREGEAYNFKIAKTILLAYIQIIIIMYIRYFGSERLIGELRISHLIGACVGVSALDVPIIHEDHGTIVDGFFA